MENHRSLRQTSFFLVALAVLHPLSAQVNVTTYHNDVSRTGQNTHETTLTQANVTYNTFGKLFSVSVDGQVFAQPLILSKVVIRGVAHTVLYTATQNDSVYANDASTGALYWKQSLGTPVPYTELPSGGCGDIKPNYGITSTPVIDPAAGTLYVVAQINQSEEPVYQLHALNVETGKDRVTPVTIGGAADGITFTPADQMIRTGLLLVGGHVIFGAGSHCDNSPWWGWVFSYNASTLNQEGIYNTEPVSGESAGVWMAGGAIAADSVGNVYFTTGNSSDFLYPDLSDSIIKATPPPLHSASNTLFTILDYFSPSASYLRPDGQNTDADVGSGGVLLLPNTSRLVQMGKPGDMYLVNTTTGKMGKYCGSPGCPDQIVQEVDNASVGVWGSPAYWNGNVFYGSASESDGLRGAASDTVKAFSFNANGSGLLSTTPRSVTPSAFAWPTPTPSVSSNGTQNGIVWFLDTSAHQSSCIPNGRSGGCAILYAFNATNLSKELYNSNMAPYNLDAPGGAVKFTVPTIANGKVYVGTQNSVAVYGGISGRPPAVDQPFFKPPGQTFLNSIQITMLDGTPNVTFHCLINQGTATPNSPVCNNPVTLQGIGTFTLSAVATASGYYPSHAFTQSYTGVP